MESKQTVLGVERDTEVTMNCQLTWVVPDSACYADA